MVPRPPKSQSSKHIEYPALRMRADSTGSTRGAFAATRPSDNWSPPRGLRHRTKAKPSTDPRVVPANDTMAQMATAALMQEGMHYPNYTRQFNAREASGPHLADSHRVPFQPPLEPIQSDHIGEEDISPISHSRYGTIADLKNKGSYQSREAPLLGTFFLESSENVSSERQQHLHDTETLSDDEDSDDESLSFSDRIMVALEDWLLRQMYYNEADDPVFKDKGSIASFFRYYFWNPVQPEFSSVQLCNWGIILGVLMGVYAALWKMIIELGVDFFWVTVPEFLLKIGVFTNTAGAFPLYHYNWICPALFGGILSYVFCVLPNKIPDQNDWIQNLHSRGVQDCRTFGLLFILSTMGMWSGLSLGPELPLVLTGGMVGSWLGITTRQTMLQARVLNLTAAGAAVAAFFGFPLAGGIFVLELPHREGIQYFEALPPSILPSIISVLVNRMIVKSDVTGYYKYPFLNASLPSEIFWHAIVFGLLGAAIGIYYAKIVVILKTWVKRLFECPENEEESTVMESLDGEQLPLMGKMTTIKKKTRSTNWLSGCGIAISSEPSRAAMAGTVAGVLVGLVGMFVPHTLFWGEAQLQNLIDKGRTALPVFGQGDEPTAALVHLGLCMVDASNPTAVKSGFGLECSALIALSKTVVIGLSLGTGIIGGHFWGPLFVGAALANFLEDLINAISAVVGFGSGLAAYPTVMMLCLMGAAHVVIFRSPMAISLILTLTISGFDPLDPLNFSNALVAGDYSAVLPLLVFAVYVAAQVSRDVKFYSAQRSRGDIEASPNVLCEPGMTGRPVVVDRRVSGWIAGTEESSDVELAMSNHSSSSFQPKLIIRSIDDSITPTDIEREFNRRNGHQGSRKEISTPPLPPRHDDILPGGEWTSKSTSDSNDDPATTLLSSRLDEILSQPMESPRSPSPVRPSHRRTQSAPIVSRQAGPIPDIVRPRENARGALRERTESTSSRGSFFRVDSFGNIDNHQPDLLEQARIRNASAVSGYHRRVLSQSGSAVTRHSRSNSQASEASAFDNGALPMDIIDSAFNSLASQQVESDFNRRSRNGNNMDSGSSN